jgi:amidase
MLDEGATIIGKSTCENLCFSGSSHTSWPAPVLNPLAAGRSAGGSSSGSAVLVATGEADMSLGADQGGSIRVPAAWCGIVGMKPTYGLVPYTGIFSIEATVDHVGPMTANVADNALLLEVIAGPDGLDPRQQGVKTGAYSQAIARGAAGLRIGIVTEAFETEEADPQVSEHVRRAAASLADLEAIVQEVSIPVHRIARPIWAPILVEGATDLLIHGSPTNLGGLYVPGASQAVTAWKGRSGDLSVPAKVTLLASEIIRQAHGRSFYGKSQNLVRMVRQAYDDALSRFDLLVMPTTPQLPTALPPGDAPLEDVWQVALNMNINTCPFCATGHPSLSIPSGLVDGLPVGLMLTGRHWDEATIYAAAHAYEQARRVNGS